MGLGRWYFAAQSLGGAVWWAAVFLSPPVRTATLGDLDPVFVAALDIPLFVIASALAAAGLRVAMFVATLWTALVALALAVYATVTWLAGIGVVIMLAAAGGSVVAAALVLLDGRRVPAAWIAVGPFAFRPADRTAPVSAQLRHAGAWIVLFWGLFLGVIPAVIVWFEQRWQLAVELPAGWRAVTVVLGIVCFLVGSVLGLWSSVLMAVLGAGTPLPSSMPNRLVIAGPYRFLRNPMAVGGISQGVAVGLLWSSWMVVAYAVCGAVLWHLVVRPVEEEDLERRFGAPYRRYREKLRCWIPVLRPYRP